MSRIVLIQGHPDPDERRLCHALGAAYALAAEMAGHEVTLAKVAALDFPLLRTQEDWNSGREGTPPSLRDVQERCLGADHLVLVYPLWLGTMPALLKGFLEQVFRPGVALSNEAGELPKPALKGKSARVIVTMGMPAAAYRWFFRAHSLKSLERNILKFAGIRPVRETLFGLVDSASEKQRSRWFAQVRKLGERAR